MERLHGSGRYWGCNTKATVENCYALDINWMVREGMFDGSGWPSGLIRWSNSHTGEQTSSVGYAIDIPQRRLHLQYRRVRDNEDMDYNIPLTTSALPWGGVRWWFVCPLSCNGRYCGGRVSKLYLPPGRRFYGCRRCYDLTYESCRESHRYDRLFAFGGRDLGMSLSDAQAIVEEGRWHHNFERMTKRNEQRRRRRKARNWR
ncbi:MAG: hypothetical protein ACYC26_12685 [Phycisphaerales bacterium]